MKKSRRIMAMLFSVLLLLGGELLAQTTEHLNFSGGAGFSVPTDGAGRNLNTGWNLGFRGGYTLSPIGPPIWISAIAIGASTPLPWPGMENPTGHQASGR